MAPASSCYSAALSGTFLGFYTQAYSKRGAFTAKEGSSCNSYAFLLTSTVSGAPVRIFLEMASIWLAMRLA